jgi:hypothetical protein
MSEEQKDKNQIVSAKDASRGFSLEDFKAMYFVINAKPDSDIKIFEKEKRVSLDDLIELNNRIQEKARNHEIATSLSRVTINYSNNRTIEYSLWQDFLDSHFDISPNTEAISLVWEMNIIIPGFSVPQPHTVKLRIGSPLKPTEMFHVMMSSDYHEVKNEMAHTVCTIDFVNAVICNEFFTIISEWHEALPNVLPKNKLLKYLSDHPRRFFEATKLFFLLGGLLVVLSIIHLILQQPNVQMNSCIFVERLFQFFAYAYLAIYISLLVGRMFAKWIQDNIDSIDDYPIFSLTKGDKNKIDEVTKKNKSLLNEILIKLLVSLIILLLGFFFDKLVLPIFKIFY